MISNAISYAAAIALAACHTLAAEPVYIMRHPALVAALDRTLASDSHHVVLQSDGRLAGTSIEGTWWEENDMFCRTLTKPVRLSGTECEAVSLDGDRITFAHQNGRTSTWIIR